jgi:cellulose synthase/poly-beta-1,6-N-acetylglucosamine synthase-like glycosyltransferase
MAFTDTKMNEILGEWPTVSVFVAARNEENNLSRCLTALSNQNYPGIWEVWVADDHSTDQTEMIAKAFVGQHNNFHFISVPDANSEVKGKALALACMAEKAVGSIFLVCDADMQMPSGWIRAMVSAMQKHRVDLINGTTATEGKALFSALQAIDWLIPQGTFAWLSLLGVSYTAMGNNMGITRKAYEATGGYFKIPFSLTEDFELFYQAKKLGFRLIHVFDTAVFGISAPQKSVSDWLEQHIRWMIGFMKLSFRQQWIFYAQLLLIPVFLLSFLFKPNVLSVVLGSAMILKVWYECALLVRIRQWHLLPYVLVYQLLWWPAYMWCWIGFLRRKTVSWKGRKWDLNEPI